MNTKPAFLSIADIPPNAKVILYDGVCVFCNKAIRIIYRNDGNKVFYFAHLQSDMATQIIQSQNNQEQPINSIYLYDGTNLYSSSTAVLKIHKLLNWPFPILYVFILLPKFIRDWVYGLTAQNRYRWFGKYDECTIPNEGLKERFLGNNVHIV